MVVADTTPVVQPRLELPPVVQAVPAGEPTEDHTHLRPSDETRPRSPLPVSPFQVR